MTQDKPLVSVEDLRITFAPHSPAPVEAVKGVSFTMQAGETVAVVGESGSGKSVSALALGGLLPKPPVCAVTGEITVADVESARASRPGLRALRGKRLAYIFQEPSACLNPMIPVGPQLEEAFKLHRPEVKDRGAESIAALEAVGIRQAAERMRAYPEELSGGMLQRVMIALALAGQPDLLVADEPTTALDATIQKQIIDLLRYLRQTHGMAILLITHNLGLVKDFADRTLVMWRGEIVESGPTADLIREPQHAYTKALLACIPQPNHRGERLPTLADFGL